VTLPNYPSFPPLRFPFLCMAVSTLPEITGFFLLIWRPLLVLSINHSVSPLFPGPGAFGQSHDRCLFIPLSRSSPSAMLWSSQKQCMGFPPFFSFLSAREFLFSLLLCYSVYGCLHSLQRCPPDVPSRFFFFSFPSDKRDTLFFI